MTNTPSLFRLLCLLCLLLCCSCCSCCACCPAAALPAVQVKAAVLKFVTLSSDALNGPVPALPSAQQRHTAVLAVQGHLLHLCDALMMVTHADEARGGLPVGAMSPAGRRLVLAVGEQVGGVLNSAMCGGALWVWQQPACCPKRGGDTASWYLTSIMAAAAAAAAAAD
jgi:hypothetical protein